jgi:hypothetical protein
MSKKSALDVFKEKQAIKSTAEKDVTTLQNSNVIQSNAGYKERKVYKNVPWYPPTEKLKKELKKLALDEDTSMSNLITEGIGLVFAKRGKNIDEYM